MPKEVKMDLSSDSKPKEKGKKSTKKQTPVKKVKKEKRSAWKRIRKFFSDLKGEWKKIVWPTRKQVRNNLVVVVVAIILIGAFIWLVDFTSSWGLRKVLEWVGR